MDEPTTHDLAVQFLSHYLKTNPEEIEELDITYGLVELLDHVKAAIVEAHQLNTQRVIH